MNIDEAYIHRVGAWQHDHYARSWHWTKAMHQTHGCHAKRMSPNRFGKCI